jgi:hypothetical protein
MKPLKFNPTNINDFENLDLVEDWSFKEQEEVASKDPLMKQLLAHRDIDMKMKVKWSQTLQIYLLIFTILMFATLWFNGQCGMLGIEKFCISHLSETTLNFLITVGFAKVIGVVWIIVRHLFPATK